MWFFILTLSCPYVIIDHYYSLLSTGNVLGLVHSRKGEWLLARWTNRLGMCWETSEEGEKKVEVLSFVWLLLLTPFFWPLFVRFEDLPFLIYPSSYFVFILFCILNCGKLRRRRFLCCISAAFYNSSLVLYRYGSAPACICAENLEAVHQGFPVVHLCSMNCVAVNRAGSISGEDKDLSSYSEWLTGNTILRNTVGMSHQNTLEDRDIYRTPFHSAIV